MINFAKRLSPNTLGFSLRRFSSNLNLIEQTLKKRLNPRHIEISDESGKHHEASDSHFSVYIVSDQFEGAKLIKRHQIVNKILKEEGIMDKIHALSMTTHTDSEFETAHPHKAAEYPCRGGSKFDKKNKQ